MAKRKDKRGGSVPSGGGEEAACDLVWRANGEFEKRLLFIMNGEDDPGLSAIDNKRRRYARILWALRDFVKIDHDELSELRTYIGSLASALEDLIEGVTDPLFVTKGSKRDSRRIWAARLQAALGVECLILSGLSRETAASDAARHCKALARLKRGESRDLKGSLLSWYDGYVERRVPVPELLEAFQAERRELKTATLSQAEYRRRGEGTRRQTRAVRGRCNTSWHALSIYPMTSLVPCCASIRAALGRTRTLGAPSAFPRCSRPSVRSMTMTSPPFTASASISRSAGRRRIAVCSALSIVPR
jgi:hypothetical protein